MTALAVVCDGRHDWREAEDSWGSFTYCAACGNHDWTKRKVNWWPTI